MKWLRDEDFIRGKIPMTKFEVRVLTLAMLDICSGDVFLDVGAGSGSISIQAAMLCAKVFAVEREVEGLELIAENSEKFNAAVNVIGGNAPEVLENIEAFNKCFIGGSGGKLSAIVLAVSEKLLSGGIIVGNFIIPDNMIEFKNLLMKLGYEDIEVRLIQCSVMDRLGLMKGQNPVYIVKGRKI
ncbi:precorrin-6Y C5,15-methyltransferase (decarboxylating) subunit CbiT [Clostridium estertheticum]|uniref:precorrin-6Y C5,15-methyltransferase (decarboxylating) subunit CbiT n=1 Tax=Clostridium estertheticum TaxID=238834 RepID=UPI0013E98443|nr:precorrin-6Y C5,15-methyltransferase (decarboxylating) subunit CbiT [Clostridium estertheticum]MBZ9687084.1 precorrin-6Y C5,15-methyltransferase (decarboxylating) subunit CbiT [Clostridium estertheticum]